MNNQDFDTRHESDATPSGRTHHHDPSPTWSLARKSRLLTRLLRSEMRKPLHTGSEPTRGDMKVALRDLEERVHSAVTAEDLALTIATLDKITNALGGPDALPFRPRGRRGHGGHPFFARGHGHSQCQHREHRDRERLGLRDDWR